jgi:hypothetical protein
MSSAFSPETAARTFWWMFSILETAGGSKSPFLSLQSEQRERSSFRASAVH